MGRNKVVEAKRKINVRYVPIDQYNSTKNDDQGHAGKRGCVMTELEKELKHENHSKGRWWGIRLVFPPIWSFSLIKYNFRPD